MRFSSLAALMLPLAALAAPTLVQRDSELSGPVGQIQNGLDHTTTSLTKALDFVKDNNLDAQNSIQRMINTTIGMINLKPQLGNLAKEANGPRRGNECVDTPPQSN